MPHCIIEHANTFHAEELMAAVFKGTLDSGLFSADGRDIKVRAQAYNHYQTGHQHQDFVHVAIKILSGRTPEQKQGLSHHVLTELERLKCVNCSLTVEVLDIDIACYAKAVY